MTSKRTFHILAGAILAFAAFAAVASAGGAQKHASILIRHQTRGCHSWSVNGGPFRASQSVVLRHGGSITIKNDDVMPHKLVQTSGRPVRYAGNRALNHVGATMKVSFAKAGTYRFTTKPGEDYMKGIKTIGEDNVLRLTVKVS